MDFDRIHTHCASLAVTAMLTAAFFSTAPDGLIAAAAGPMGASAVLESALAGLRADGWHGTAGLTLPTMAVVAQTKQASPPSKPSSFPFTEEQFRKIKNFWDTHPNKEVVYDLRVTRPIGLSKGNEIIDARKIAGRDEVTHIYHALGRLNNGTGYLLSYEPPVGKGDFRYYWVDFDFRVIAAISIPDGNPNGAATVIPAKGAQAEVESECAVWVKVANEQL